MWQIVMCADIELFENQSVQSDGMNESRWELKNDQKNVIDIDLFTYHWCFSICLRFSLDEVELSRQIQHKIAR